jgi:hypothetical protein
LGKNTVEELPLKDQVKQMLEESRVVLPGIQALFGFQLIAVFSDGFGKKLNSSEQRLHLWALGLTVLAIALSMAPAAIHRQSQPESVSNRLVKLGTILLSLGMAPLATAIGLDFYLMCRTILKNSDQSLAIASGVGVGIVFLWLVLPYLIRGYLKQPEPAKPEILTPNTTSRKPQATSG